MAERRVSVRLVAVGGRELKAEMTDIGREGQRALDGIAVESREATQGINAVSGAAADTLRQMEALAARAGRAAAAMRAAGTSSSDVMDRINRATGVAPAAGQATREVLEQGRALDDLRAKYNPLFGVVRGYRQELAGIRAAHLEGAISADEMTAAITRERQFTLASIAALKGRSTALTQMAGAERNAAFQSRMLMFQLNDVAVSLAGGMNPLMVAAQQGAQIQQIYAGQGGVNAALRQTSAMLTGVVTRFPLMTAAIAAGTVAVAGMRKEINDTSDATVAFGDVALAVWQTVADALVSVLKPAVDAIAPWFERAWDAVVNGVHWAGNLIINAWRVTVDAIGTAVDTVPDIFLGAFSLAVSHALTKLHDLTWHVAQAVNGIAEGFNSVFGTDFATDNMSGVVDALSEGSGAAFRTAAAAGDRIAGAWGEFGSRAAATMQSDPLGAFFGAVRDRALTNALDETAEAAGRAGGATRAAGEDAAEAAERAKSAWETASAALSDYAAEAIDLGRGLGDSLVGAFRSAEDAIGDFVKTGKADVRDLIGSIIADLARLSARRFILAPLANALAGTLGALGGRGAAALLPLPSFDAGGHTGLGARTGGLDGRGGFLAMLHPRERVIDETHGRSRELAPVHITINARDAASFRQSRTQVAADIARAVSAGRRGL